MKLGVALAMLMLFVACHGYEAQKGSDLQCRGCVASGGRWCARSSKNDADGVCFSQNRTREAERGRHGRCYGTLITAVEQCPNDVPESKTTCTACSGDDYVWCAPRKDIFTLLPLKPMCRARPQATDDQPIPIEDGPGSTPDGHEVHIPEHDMVSDDGESSSAFASDSESESDSDSDSEGEDEHSIDRAERNVMKPPPLIRQKAFFFKSAEEMDEMLGGEHKRRVCPREYVPVYTLADCAALTPDPQPQPQPQPKPQPQPDSARVRKWFVSQEMRGVLSFAVFAGLTVAVIACCVAARRRRAQRLAAARAAYSPLGPQGPMQGHYPGQFPPGGAHFDGFPGNFNSTHGMLVAEPVNGTQETVIALPPQQGVPVSSSSSSSSSYPRGLPVITPATVATNAVQAIPVPDSSRPMSYNTPMYPPLAPRQAEQQLLPRGYAGHVPQQPQAQMPMHMHMQHQPPQTYRVNDIPTGPREQQPAVQLQVGIPVHQSRPQQPAMHYAPSAPSAPSGRDLEMSLLSPRESASATPAPSRMYPQMSHDGYMRLE